MKIVDVLLFSLACLLFGAEAWRTLTPEPATRSLLAAGAFFFALAFLVHALVAL